MKAIIRNYFKNDRIIGIGTAAGLAINLCLWLAIYFRFRKAAEAVPLSYDVYFGISSTGPWFRLFKFPLLGLVIILVNLFFIRLFPKKEKIIAYFLIFSSLAAQCLLLLEGLLLFNL